MDVRFGNNLKALLSALEVMGIDDVESQSFITGYILRGLESKNPGECLKSHEHDLKLLECFIRLWAPDWSDAVVEGLVIYTKGYADCVKLLDKSEPDKVTA